MKASVAVLLLALVAVLLLSLVAAEGGKGGSGDGLEEDALSASRREGRLFAFLTTTSVKRLATTTITAISTCLSTSAAACTGRKKKSLFLSIDNLEDFLKHDQEGQALDSTLTGSLENQEKVKVFSPKSDKREKVDRKGRKLTIWSTYISTLTLTSTSYLTGTTITATALCSAPGITQGCFGK